MTSENTNFSKYLKNNILKKSARGNVIINRLID